MGIIEEAARRLETLRLAGVPVPWAEVHRGDAAALGQPPGMAGPADAARADPAPNAAETVHLDLERLVAEGHIAAPDSRTSLVEEFRHLKWPILRNVKNGRPEERASLIMVTSALPGEGKTFCAINLAMSLAIEVDTSVLLVDADVVRPALMDRLGLRPRKGLLDILADGHGRVDDLVLQTNVPKLSLLPAGAPRNRSNELLASAAMDSVLSQLAAGNSNRIVVLDAPPLLVTSDAKVLASKVGQILVVVRASRTPRRAVEQAFEVIKNCSVAMSVLNKGTERLSGYGHYGDYYR